MGPSSRALIAPTVFDAAPSHQSERAGSGRRTSCDLPRHISTRKIKTGIFAIIEGPSRRAMERENRSASALSVAHQKRRAPSEGLRRSQCPERLTPGVSLPPHLHCRKRTLSARTLGLISRNITAAVHRPRKHLIAMAGNHGACDEKNEISLHARREKFSVAGAKSIRAVGLTIARGAAKGSSSR
jgi:hypothetical protein